MHFCMKNGVGGRIQAGLACVLSCAYPPSTSTLKQVVEFSITDCEASCNNHFMNVRALSFGKSGLLNGSDL